MNRSADKVTEFEIKTVDTSGDLSFSGWLARYGNVDSDDDLIKAGAFAESVAELSAKRRPFPVLYMHDMREMIGVYTSVEERPEGVFVEGTIGADVSPQAQSVVKLMRRGWLNSLSVGFTVTKQSFQDDIRMIEKGTLWEGSIVSIPANEDAAVISVKSFKSAIQGEPPIEKLTRDELEGMTLAEAEGALAKRFMSRQVAKALVSGLSRLRDEEEAKKKRRDDASSVQLREIRESLARIHKAAKGN